MGFYLWLWQKLEKYFIFLLFILLCTIFFIQILYSFPKIRKHISPVEKLEGEKISFLINNLT